MKKSIVWVLLGAAMIFFGSACGGGGGGTSSDGSTDAGTTGLSNVQLIGVLQGTDQGVLPNIAVGDTVQLEFIGTDDTRHQVVRQGSNWSTTASASVATVDSSGLLHAIGAGSGTVMGTGPNGVQTVNFTVGAVQTFVTGRVRNVNTTGVAAVKVLFYNNSGTQVGSTITGPTGNFRANVGANATGFTVDIEQADPTTSQSVYYRQFTYNDKFYLNGTDCLASLPTLTAGGSNPLPSDIVLADRASGPPPPPTGCLAG